VIELKKYLVFFLISLFFLTSSPSWYLDLKTSSSKEIDFCAAIVNSTEANYWPTEGWLTSSPGAQGMVPHRLEDMGEYIVIQDIARYIDSLLIVRHGCLVYESYPSSDYNETKIHHIYSCTKSFTSALIGIALDEGYINNIDDHVLDYFPNRTFDNMNNWKEAITIEHLLTMTTGLEWNDQINFYNMAASYDWVQYVLNRPMETLPGTSWNYNTGASHLLSSIVEKVSPNGTLEYAKEHIFDPLNFSNYSWETDPYGIPIGGTLLHITSRDMAKFGLLYLHEGIWDGIQLVPSNWVRKSTKAYMMEEFDQGHGSGYGFQWWIYNWAKAFTARGSYEQYIVVVPDYDMIIVSTGNADFHFIELLVNYILPSVGFYPLNLEQVLLLIGISIMITIVVFVIYRIHHEKELSRLKKEYLSNFS
jgi:CubicO group peptidase (beta-lactamase class C family)